ncbi:autophagy- protein 2, partial [Kickxella alabastrina]
MWPSTWSFSLPSWAVSNSLQKRLVKFLLRRTVGQFLKTELDDENLDVQLSGGQLRLKNVQLSEEATIGSISVSVPWTQLWTAHCEVQIDNLVIKAQLADDELPLDKDGGEAEEHWMGGRSHMAESVVMTEGGASILASSVFIADDFLRAETLGYGSKDEMFINKDVERLVANAHEERAQYYRASLGSGEARQQGKRSYAVDADDEDVFEDCADNLPLPPGSPGGSVRGLQVVSEMVDRIISAVNIRVHNITVECLVVTHDEHTGETTNDTLKLSVASIDFVDDRSNTERKSGVATESGGKGNMSGDGSSSDRDHPVGIEYKVIEYRTLFKLLEIKGLRMSLLSDTAAEVPIISLLGTPISAHLRIHRRMPFSELAPVRPSDGGSSGSGGRPKSANGSESLYMGPMPGEFREAKAGSPHISPTSATYAQGSSGTRARNAVGEEATTSGWDVSVEIGDVVCILTKDQLQSILAIARTAAPLLKLASERQDVKHRYQVKFGDKAPGPAADTLPQLARWISVKCRHLYVAVVPHAPIEALQNWQDCTSLAVLRLNLEAAKHLGLYVKGVGAKWECIPASATRSESSASTEHVGTEFWAAATRQTTSGGAFQTATITAYMQSVSVYDSDPESHPVFRPLVTIDRSLAAPECQRHEKRAFAEHARRNSDKYDVWMCTSESDPVLTINVGPIIIVLDKELADRLGIYQELIVGMLSAEPTVEHIHNRGSRTFADNAYSGSDVAGSIEDLMNNLRLQAKHKIPLSIAVCSPLIRTWIRLPGTTANSGKKDGPRTSQTGSRTSKHDVPAPGHFCIDAVDAVITNVVNGTAASTQSQNDVPEGHLRHPHIQELLESRKSVAGSGIRVECEALDISVQSIEGGSAIDHIASVRGPSSAAESFHEAVSIPRPHIEITTVAKSGRQTLDRDSAEQFGRRPPAFDAFSVVDDNIRVRMAPESELTTSLKFERLAVALSRLVVSCHLPETEISLGRATYQRLNAVINDFMLWQSIQEEARAIAAAAAQHTYDTPAYATSTTDDRAELGVSVLVDMPQMVARINTTDTYSADIPGAASESQRVRLSNTQAFISNAIIEKGRMYVSVESNQVRLSSFVNESEVGAMLSHSFATPESPIFTPQLSLYMLTSPKITEESEVVLKTSWTTVDYQNDSTCLRNLEAFFSSPGTSGLVQPPPKPMRLSLNVQNSSLMWTPAGDPSICSAALSLDSLAVIVGINSPAPARDREELHYYIEGLSVFAKSTDSLANAAVDVSNDAWVSTGRFWKDHGYAVLVHMDMVDVASRSKEGEDGPLIDLKLYSEALVLDACADSVSSLPLLIQGLIADLTGSAGRQASETKRSNKTRAFSPQMLGKTSDDIFGDVDNDTFAMAPLPPTASKVAYTGKPHSHRSSRLSGDYRNSFTDDFENGRDDISALAMEEYFAPHVPPDEVEEYEVVGGGRVLSPASTMQPMYSRRSSQHQQPTLPSRRSFNVSATARQPLEIRRDSKGKSASKTLAGSIGSASVGVAGGRSRSYSFGDDDDEDFDLQDYVNMDSDSDMLSEEEEAEYRSGFAASAKSQPFQLQSRFSGQQVNAGGSVLLELERPSPTLRSPKSKSLAGGFLPSARILDDIPAIHESISGSGRGESVKVTALPEEEDIGELGDKDKADVLAGDDTSLLDGSAFELIEDYFKAPAPGDTASDDDRSGLAADGNNHIICLTVDVARVEVNLYSGQDWYVSAEQPVRSSPVVPGYMASYMDDYNDSASVAMGGYSESLNGRVSASMP